MTGALAYLESPLQLRPGRGAYGRLQAENLFQMKNAEVVRLLVPKGKEIPPHRAPGELLVHCVEGRVAFTAMGETCELSAGQLLHLPADKHHALRSLEDSALLMVILTAPVCHGRDVVEEASEDSFPASDSPGWIGVREG